MARKTLANQLDALHSERLAAVDVFTKASVILDETASAYRDLADQAYAEANERTQVATEAVKSATIAAEKARKIRELLG